MDFKLNLPFQTLMNLLKKSMKLSYHFMSTLVLASLKCVKRPKSTACSLENCYNKLTVSWTFLISTKWTGTLVAHVRNYSKNIKGTIHKQRRYFSEFLTPPPPYQQFSTICGQFLTPPPLLIADVVYGRPQGQGGNCKLLP